MQPCHLSQPLDILFWHSYVAAEWKRGQGVEEEVNNWETKRNRKEAGQGCQHSPIIFFKIFHKENKILLKYFKHHNLYFSSLSLSYLQTTRLLFNIRKQALTEEQGQKETRKKWFFPSVLPSSRDFWSQNSSSQKNIPLLCLDFFTSVNFTMTV